MFALAMAVTLANCIPVGCRAVDSMSTQLRRETLDLPAAIRFPGVAQPVVQAALAPLPKLDRGRVDRISAPVRRRRNVLPETRLRIRKRLLERSAIWNHVTLPRRPRAKPAEQG